MVPLALVVTELSEVLVLGSLMAWSSNLFVKDVTELFFGNIEGGRSSSKESNMFLEGSNSCSFDRSNSSKENISLAAASEAIARLEGLEKSDPLDSKIALIEGLFE